MNKHFETCELLLNYKCSDEQILERLISDIIEFENLNNYRARKMAKLILEICK